MNYLASRDAYWIDPRDTADPRNPPPRGTKIQLLNCTGTSVQGDWRDDGGFIGWHPLLKIPPSLKALVTNPDVYARRKT